MYNKLKSITYRSLRYSPHFIYTFDIENNKFKLYRIFFWKN